MKLYSISVEGSSHKFSGTPCQDYSICKEFEKFSIIALSDGHGSKTYVRSNIGSKLACEIALNLTQRFIEENYYDLASTNIIEKYSPDFESRQNPSFAKLFNDINSNWKSAIKEDSEANPFSNIEKSSLGSADIKHAYGCTLMVGVKSEDFTFIFHIGDGRAFTISYLNEWEQPVPWDRDCVDNITTSLCEENPVYRVRYYFNSTQNQPLAILLCSDGIEDCYGGEHDGNFNSEDLIVDYGEVLRCFMEDDDFNESCIEFLDGQSKSLSHDDMSICIIVDDRLKLADKWLQMIEHRKIYTNIRQVLSDLKKKLTDVIQRIASVNKNINRLDEEINNLNSEKERLLGEIQNKEALYKDLSLCNESGKIFKGDVEEFLKRVEEYQRKRENSKSVKDFINRLIRIAVTGLRVILQKIQSELDSNKRQQSSLANDCKKLKERVEEIEEKLSTYTQNRERDLSKLIGLQDKQRKLQEDLDCFGRDNEEVQERALQNLDELKREISSEIESLKTDSIRDNVNEKESIVSHSENHDNTQTLSISKFSSDSGDEDIQIQVRGGTYFVEYNGYEEKEIDKNAFDKVLETLRSVDRNKDLSERSSDCIVVTNLEKNKERIISLDSQEAGLLWDLCLSLVSDKQSDA